jgi:predicted GTPase
LLEIIDYLQFLRMFLVLIEFEVVLQVFKIGSEYTDAIEEVRPKVKIILFTQPQLIIVIVQTLLGQTDYLSRLLQTHLLEVVLTLMNLPPPLNYLNHLENDPLLTTLLLQG